MSEKYNCSNESIEHRFDSYIKLCVKHRCWREFQKYLNRFSTLYEISWDAVDAQAGTMDCYPSDHMRTQIDEFLIELENQELNNLLRILPKRIRTAVIMSVIYEMSNQEIADYMNVRHSTVWNYKSMGLGLMRTNYLGKSGVQDQEKEE